MGPVHCGENVPAAQLSQKSSPISGWNFPAAQLEQLACAWLLPVTVPAAQKMHVVFAIPMSGW